MEQDQTNVVQSTGRSKSCEVPEKMNEESAIVRKNISPDLQALQEFKDRMSLWDLLRTKEAHHLDTYMISDGNKTNEETL